MSRERTGQGARIVPVPADRDGQRLDNFIAGHLPGVPRSVIYRVIRKGQVRINGGRAKPATRISTGDKVRIPPAHISTSETPNVPDSVKTELQSAILSDHKDFIVLNKPSGLAVHAGSGIRWGVIEAMRALYPEAQLELVHRLDRETSGCLLLTSSRPALTGLREQFRSGVVRKRYFCLTRNRMPDDRIFVDAPLAKVERGGERMVEVSENGKSATTEFRLLEHYGEHSFVEAIPGTGRTHQIRAHAVHLGLALAGDSKYGTRDDQRYWKQKGLKRLFLHAHSLAFHWPEDAPRQYSAPLPPVLRGFLDRL